MAKLEIQNISLDYGQRSVGPKREETIVLKNIFEKP